MADKRLNFTAEEINEKLGNIGEAHTLDVAENGLFVTDNNLNIGIKYDADGLDCAVVSSHLKGLINN